MEIRIRLFAGIREAVGVSQELLTVPDNVKTVGDVRRLLRERGGAWSEALAEGRTLRMAYNHEISREDRPLDEGCEVAFFPPVTGG
jgi:molybdopterin synthase sulfur carrier subunit